MMPPSKWTVAKLWRDDESEHVVHCVIAATVFGLVGATWAIKTAYAGHVPLRGFTRDATSDGKPFSVRESRHSLN